MESLKVTNSTDSLLHCPKNEVFNEKLVFCAVLAAPNR